MVASGSSLAMNSFTQALGMMFGPYCSPVCSFTATLPWMRPFTRRYSFLMPSADRSRVK